MFGLVADLSAAQSEIVVSAKLDDIRKEVIAFDDKVLDDSINRRVRNFNARNGDIARALEGTRYDDIREILDQMRLESNFAILASAKIMEQLLNGLGESLVLWVLVELISKELELVQNAVSMVAVAFAEEEMSSVIQSIPLVGRLVLEDISLLLQAAAHVLVNRLEPVLELWVLVSISIDVVDGLEKIIGAG
jgi:hypothetical protein